MLIGSQIRHQGFALLVFLVVLMGLGGVLLAQFADGVKKEVDVRKYQKNLKVLNEAKAALLQFAYNYPETDQQGPGHLPCPDADNNGQSDLIGCANVGRFPWANDGLNFYDAEDADGERLWYAVSSSFATIGGGADINSDTVGAITLRDQTGAVIYDGSSDGVAAVIIAPGATTTRNGVEQDRSPANEDNPVHYLDLVNGVEDNANFTSGSATDGFILGPIETPGSGDITVNDQFIVVTADEVKEVAEKAVLQAYKESMLEYLDNVEIASSRVYPWLFRYNTDDHAIFEGNSNFVTERTNNLTDQGRIPSIFGRYFAANGVPTNPIETRLRLDLDLVIPLGLASVGFEQDSPSVLAGNMGFSAVDPINLVVSSSGIMEDVAFGVESGGFVPLTGTVGGTNIGFLIRHFWHDSTPTGTTNLEGPWTICPDTGDDVSDCNRDGGPPVAGGPSTTPSHILQMTIIFRLADLPFLIEADFDPAPAISYVNADNFGHALIEASVPGNQINDVTFPVEITYQYDHSYLSSFDNESSGFINLDDLLNGGNLTLRMRYYPELPDWALSEGWYDSIRLDYADNLRPDIATNCIAGTDCITINGLGGVNNDIRSVLVLAGQHDWDDPLDFTNDIVDIFDAENDLSNDILQKNDPIGNDKLLVIE